MRVASGYQRPRSWLRSGDSLQPEAPPERRRVAGQASALAPQQPPRQRAGCERIIVVLVHAMPCNVGGAITALRSLPPIPSPGRCSWPRTSLLIFQCTAPELCQRATHSLRSARPHGARPAVPMAAVAFLHHAPLATTKKPIAVPRSRAARADVPVIDGRLPRQRRLLNRAILQASSEAISWPSDSIAVGVYLHRLPGADLT